MFDTINASEESIFFYLPKIKSRSSIIYLSLLAGIFVCFLALPFISIDISVKTNGITRPKAERTDVKSIISGIIDSIFFKEGDFIEKGATLLHIKEPTTKAKRERNHFEILQLEKFIRDLGILTSVSSITLASAALLSSPLYKQQAARFLHQKAEQEASLKKADREVEINSSLAKEKVISPKEFFDSQVNLEKLASGYQAFTHEQLSSWQQDLVKYRLELSQFQQQDQQIATDATYFEVKAPVSGIVQGIDTRYAGGHLQANETLCSISPEEEIIGECYVPTKDIGLLKKNQAARYQLEAFDYNYFGVLTGKIISIDNDYTAVDNKPVFKVRCSFDSAHLSLKNGFSGQLKKGLRYQASFIVARRSLWQLLFDKLDDWLNPGTPSKQL